VRYAIQKEDDEEDSEDEETGRDQYYERGGREAETLGAREQAPAAGPIEPRKGGLQ